MRGQDKTKLSPTIFAPQPLTGAEAALYFIDDQLLFQRVNASGEQTCKLIAPAAARAAFAAAPIDSGWLPEGVNRWGESQRGVWMLRWHRPQVYRLSIAGQKKRLTVPLPALVWFGQGTSYYLAAMKGASLDPAGALYHAPLANVNRHGLVCFGKNSHPDVRRGGFDKAWLVFWNAPFNDDHSDGKSRAAPDSINKQLIRLSQERKERYPAPDLEPMNLTLDQYVRALARQGDTEER
jgi:PRTRC genetic system protein B